MASLDTFVNDFVVSENKIYDYTKQQKKSLRRRLSEATKNFMYEREKKLYDHIHYLNHKNRILEDEYESLSKYAINSIHKTIINENVKKNEDKSETESEDNVEDELKEIEVCYDNGYKLVFWSFIRMCFIIYLSLLFVDIYDRIIIELDKNKSVVLY